MDVLGDEVKEVDAFLIVYRYKDRFTKPFKRTLTMLTKMFGNIWSNVVLVVNFWSFKGIYNRLALTDCCSIEIHFDFSCFLWLGW